MSMALVLQATRDLLRRRMKLSEDQCDVEPDLVPPVIAGELFVAVDEGSIAGRTEETSVEEVFSIEIGICQQTSHIPQDRTGNLYLDRMFGLDDLERKVIAALHGWGTDDVRNEANALGNTGNPNQGDIFQRALFYKGRGKSDTITPPETDRTYFRRTLRFRGLDRIQDRALIK